MRHETALVSGSVPSMWRVRTYLWVYMSRGGVAINSEESEDVFPLGALWRPTSSGRPRAHVEVARVDEGGWKEGVEILLSRFRKTVRERGEYVVRGVRATGAKSNKLMIPLKGR